MTRERFTGDTMPESPPPRLGRSAAVIAAATVLSRIAGFGRILVLTWAVGIGQVLDVYNTASRVPNILYEIVAGGALASLVVPLLAAPLARREPAVVNRTAAGLLTWTLVILTPMAVVVALAAAPIMRLLAGHGDTTTAELEMGARMIAVFAPQLPLYGVGIVLTGILQAHRRFAWPAFAPLLSSVTVMGSYVAYALVAEPGAGAGDVPLRHELILSIGTTTATVVMSLCLLIPLRGLGIRFRPTLRFGGAEITRNVRSMAVAGAVTTGAWQVALLLILNLTNGGPTGTVAIFALAQTLFMLPWGVLAVPLATSAFPELSEAHGVGDETRYATTLAKTTRVLLLLSLLGTAALVGLSRPLAGIFGRIGDRGEVAPDEVARALEATILLLGPGLVGFALFALLTRALYARQAAASAAVATVIGWATVYVAAITLAAVLPVADRAAAVATGHSVGMTVLGAALLVTVVRRAGRAAVDGTLRAGVVGVVAAGSSAAAGWWVTRLWSAYPPLAESLLACLAGGVTILVVFGLVATLADTTDTRPAMRALGARAARIGFGRKG